MTGHGLHVEEVMQVSQIHVLVVDEETLCSVLAVNFSYDPI